MNIPRRTYVGLLTGGLLAGGLLLSAAAAAPAAQASPASRIQPVSQDRPVSGSPAPGSGLISWSVAPSSATAPDSRTLYSYTNIPPGATITDHMALWNRGTQSAAFQVYLTDATGTTAAGALTLLQAGQKSTDIGAWTSFAGHVSQVSVNLPGGKGIIEQFTITVPSNATPGDHTGGLIASVGVPRRNSLGQMVTVFQRIAIPVELRVAGPLSASMRVENLTASFNNPVNPFGGGSASVTYTVVNTGNVKLAGAQLITVSGGIAGSATIKPPVLPVILPGDSIRVSVTAHGLFPLGPISAKAVVTPQWPAKSTPLKAPLTLSSSVTSMFAVPWALLVMIIALVGGGYGGWRFLRWRRRE
ncbi:MAG TPA: hypothetical protein VKU39_19750, partial [Streptosporangiaceae bacterium]|nr:hypothetical protein [Streptosporangiaceae bacterium]